MSDLSIYELEDIIWDDFDRSGDHIIPHPSNNHDTEDKCEENSCKKPRHEVTVTPLQSNLYAPGGVSQIKGERDSNVLNKERDLMEKDSWSQISDGVFTASGDVDSAKDMTGLQPHDAEISNHCFNGSSITSGSELCTDDAMLKDIHQSNDLNLFSNDCDEKESADLLYYGWPDIGNFEDVDRMLSNCDSSYGLGVTGNGDELVWFTSEDPAGGYEEALKMDLKFPCSESCGLPNTSQDNGPRESDNMKSSFVSESEDEFKHKDQKKQSKQQNQTEGKKADQCFENYGMKKRDESDQVFTSIGNIQPSESLEQDSFGYIQTSSYPYPGQDHVPMQKTGGTMMNVVKSENKGPTTPSQKEIFNATNQVNSMESSGEPSFDGNQKPKGMMVQDSGNISENKSDMEGVKKGGSTDVLEGSCISSEVDEISLETTSFLQLQQVMKQLDLRTKLCIRDSLYRLARSAEQRHNFAGISDRTTNYGGTDGPLTTQVTDKCNSFMDMETDTNPIDRTIAHLLFHRPSDSSNKPTASSLKPNAKADESTTGPHMKVSEKESDDKISNSGNY